MTATSNLATESTPDSVSEHAGQVTVTFTRPQMLALFGLLQWANQTSYRLAVKGDVRDAWVELSTAWARANPGRAGRDAPAERTTTS